MKKMFILFLLMISAGKALEMTATLADNEIDIGEKVQVNLKLESINPIDVNMTYLIQKEYETLLEKNETKNSVEGTKNYKISLGNLYEPGYYNITVKSNQNSQKISESILLRVKADCITFEGITNAYSLPEQSQDYEFVIKNKCDFILHDLIITFQKEKLQSSILIHNKTVKMNNITSPKSSKNTRIEAEYFEGYSKQTVEFKIQSETELLNLINNLINSTTLLVNKTLASKSLIIIGDKEKIQQNYDSGIILVNNALQELESKNYALTIRHLSESIQYLREANNECSSTINTQIALIVLMIFPVLGGILFFIYNKYRQALKTKQLDELGKS